MPGFSFTFGISLGVVALICMALFILADTIPLHRTKLAIAATIAEAVIFLMIGWIFYQTQWDSIPSWLMALLPIGGSLSTLRMIYKRYKGLPL